MVRIPIALARLRRTALSLLLAAAAGLAASGCTEPVTMYQVPGGRVADGQKILVMPFMDTRTFVDDNDQHKYDLGYHARNIFIESMRERINPGSVILTPRLNRPAHSMTNAEVAEIGRQYNADVVISGQVFSFIDTRAASIPARAGMFVRVISAADGALLFVGDHYQAANIPGASGGRDLQARNVANRLVEGILGQAKPMAAAIGKVASATALAALVPLPAVLPPASKFGRARTGNNDVKPAPEPLPGLDGGFNKTDEWEEPITPEVPPVLDFDNDFYALPPISEPPAPPPAAKPVAEKPADVPAAPAPQPPPAIPEANAPADDDGEETVDEDDDGSDQTARIPEEEDDGGSGERDQSDLVDEGGDNLARHDDTAADEPDQAEIPLPPLPPESAPEYEGDQTIATPTPPPATATVTATPPKPRPLVSPDAVLATEIDELPEFDLGSAELSMDASEQARLADAAELSGDELGSDLFDSEGDIWPDAAPTQTAAPVQAAATSPASNAPAATTPSAAPEVEGTDDYGPFVFDPDTLELVRPQAARPAPESESDGDPAEPAPDATATAAPAAQATSSANAVPVEKAPTPAPARRAGASGVPAVTPGHFADASEDGGGPIVSTPLTADQPRTVKSVDLVELEADPALALPDKEARVVVPAQNVMPGAVRLLLLPYHDRDNPNNLIPATGGGEVVTTLYGTQLATAPEVQLMWDATGEATHTRLLSRTEALEMGRLVGADFVMRGQVVEFRRAQSVPSLYSAVISTAVLAAQVFLAEMSGVDVTTEVYRVSDGLCVMSRRDRSQQKYVVQAEKTVRRMAKGMSDSVIKVILEENPEEMDPLIDDAVPLTLFSNPR